MYIIYPCRRSRGEAGREGPGSRSLLNVPGGGLGCPVGWLRGAGALLLLSGVFWLGARAVLQQVFEYLGHFRAIPVVNTVEEQRYYDYQLLLLWLSVAQEVPDRVSGISAGGSMRAPGDARPRSSGMPGVHRHGCLVLLRPLQSARNFAKNS